MWSWLKDKWELVASGLVVLTVFILGRKKQVAAEEMVEDIIETKEKEAQVVKKIAGQERLSKALARKKYSESKLKLVRENAHAQTQLEKDIIKRKLELIELAKEDPDEIDKILMEELNIAKLK
tara:strand:+ start:268 stop:636 length:369 start_codon:yes stop_codon:yes gene_type:complete